MDVVATEGAETGAGMTNLTVAPDGTVHVAWLDLREAFARGKLPKEEQPEDIPYLDADDPKVQVRIARSTDGGGSFGPSVLIDTAASEHSRVALAAGPGGTLYAAWRSKLAQFKDSYDAVRDLMVSVSTDQGVTWSPPVKVHNDKFKAGDCPAVTHGIGTDAKGRLHVAWYTGTSTRPGVYYAVSEDEGKTFSKPLALLTDSWVPYADVKLTTDRDGQAWVAFEDRRAERLESLILARVNAQGKVERSRTWQGTAPDIAVSSRGAFVAFASAEGAIQARLASPQPAR